MTSNSDGRFELSFGLTEDSMLGRYLVDVTSMCREEHRNICSYQTVHATVSVSEGSYAETRIPTWIKTVAEFWINDQIDDSGFIRAVEFLVHADIISIPGLEASQSKSSPDVPDWIRMHAEFWVTGTVSDSEFAEGIKWLVKNGMIQI